MMLGRGRRSRDSGTIELAPVVEELFAAAQNEAILFRHDFIGTGHVLLALLGRDDETGSALRGLGLRVAGVREDARRIVGDGPVPEAAFDAEALGAIGIDLEAVRQRVETTFGEGALERAQRGRGSCGGAAFGITPHLKRALESARREAERSGTHVGAAHVALGLAEQRDSVAAGILETRGISAERLRGAVAGGGDSSA